MTPVSMKQLLEAGMHFGHQVHRWHPKMRKFIFGTRNGIHIIDLQKTIRLLKDAYNTMREAVGNGSLVLFVGTKKQAQQVVLDETARCGMFSVTNRWVGGILRKRLNLQTYKSHGVYVVPASERTKIELLCTRYGINSITDLAPAVQSGDVGTSGTF